jgi:WD40 repeat protein
MTGRMIFLFIFFSQTCWAFGQDKSAGKKQLVDFQGDPLPADAISRLGSARLQGARTRDVSFSTDGKVVAAAGYNHAVHIWDAATGKELRLFTTDDRDKPFSQTRWLYCVAFSPDGKYLTCGEHHTAWAANTVRIWDFATGMLLHTLNGAKGGTLGCLLAGQQYLGDGWI